jgi:hypothetical protein
MALLTIEIIFCPGQIMAQGKDPRRIAANLAFLVGQCLGVWRGVGTYTQAESASAILLLVVGEPPGRYATNALMRLPEPPYSGRLSAHRNPRAWPCPMTRQKIHCLQCRVSLRSVCDRSPGQTPPKRCEFCAGSTSMSEQT